MSVSVKVINSGDIAVSARTVDKLMITSDDPNAALMNQAFLDTTVQLWDQNVVNGEYVIAYELDPGLHDKLKTMLPEVCKLLLTDYTNFIRIIKEAAKYNNNR